MVSLKRILKTISFLFTNPTWITYKDKVVHHKLYSIKQSFCNPAQNQKKHEDQQPQKDIQLKDVQLKVHFLWLFMYSSAMYSVVIIPQNVVYSCQCVVRTTAFIYKNNCFPLFRGKSDKSANADALTEEKQSTGLEGPETKVCTSLEGGANRLLVG